MAREAVAIRSGGGTRGRQGPGLPDPERIRGPTRGHSPAGRLSCSWELLFTGGPDVFRVKGNLNRETVGVCQVHSGFTIEAARYRCIVFLIHREEQEQ